MDDNNGGGGATESGSCSDWAELNRDCLINILSRLSLEDRWSRAMLVCKSWLRAAQEPCVNSAFDLESHFDSTAESPRWWTPEFERRVDAMLRSAVHWSEGSLTEIRVRHCSDQSLSLAAERCPNLQVLSIKSCPHVTDECIAKVASGCPKLREIDISYCYEISHKSLAVLGKNCPNLKVVKRNLMSCLDPSQHAGIVPIEYLDACPQNGDREAVAIGKSMRNLSHLELRFSNMSAIGLIYISIGCVKLEYLDLGGCAYVTGRDFAAVKASLEKSQNIKEPYLENCFHAERYLPRYFV